MEKIKTSLNVLPSTDIEERLFAKYKVQIDAKNYLKRIGMSESEIKSNIIDLGDFILDCEYCSKCPGLENCSKDNPRICTKVEYIQGKVIKKVTPCKKALQKIKFDSQFIVSDFEKKWENDLLENINISREKNQAIIKYYNFKDKGIGNWIYLYGGPGSGRSYLSAMIVCDAARKGKGPICYLDCNTRITELKELSSNRSTSEQFQERMDVYSNCPILVLDSFGNEFKNDYIRDTVVFPIIMKRASKKLFTIITSDFTIDEIEKLYTTNISSEIRARQLSNTIRSATGKEINLGDLAIY